MSAANFKPMLYGMPMICGMTVEQRIAAAKEWYGMDDEDEGDSHLNDVLYFVSVDEAEQAQELVDEFNKTFHTVTVVPGYYDSFSLFVEENESGYFDLDKSSRDCITNEDAHDYYGMCRSAVLRKADAEKRRIVRWLNSLAGNGSFNRVVCTAVFGNGERLYDVA